MERKAHQREQPAAAATGYPDEGDGPQVQSGADAAEVERLRAGDAEAFERLVRGNIDRLLAVARRIVLDESDAHDVVQEAFMSVLKGIDRFDGRSALSTWMHRIAVNAALMKLRSRRRERSHVSIDDLLPRFQPDGHRATAAFDSAPSVEDRIDPRLAEHVREAIGTLPDEHREILVLRDVEGLSTRESAEALQITVDAAKQRLHRARLALMKLLEPVLQQHDGAAGAIGPTDGRGREVDA